MKFVKIENNCVRGVHHFVSDIDSGDSDTDSDPGSDSADNGVDSYVEPVNLVEFPGHLCESEEVIDEVTDRFEMVVIV